MPRTSVTLTESSLNQVDSKAKERGLTRSDYIAAAVESALHGSDADLNQMKTDLNQLKMELNQSKADLNQSKLELMQSQRSISKLENQIAEKDKIIEATQAKN